MAMAVRPSGAGKPVQSDDEHTVDSTTVCGRIVVSPRYALELQICEQTTPICGWVIVAFRGKRVTRLHGVYTSRIRAEVVAHTLAGRWAHKFGRAEFDAASLTKPVFWELEWQGTDTSPGLSKTPETSASPFDRRATFAKRVI